MFLCGRNECVCISNVTLSTGPAPCMQRNSTALREGWTESLAVSLSLALWHGKMQRDTEWGWMKAKALLSPQTYISKSLLAQGPKAFWQVWKHCPKSYHSIWKGEACKAFIVLNTVEPLTMVQSLNNMAGLVLAITRRRENTHPRGLWLQKKINSKWC